MKLFVSTTSHNIIVLQKERFNLTWIHVFTATNDHILIPTDNLNVALVVHFRRVACMIPTAGVDGLTCFLIVAKLNTQTVIES